MGPQRQPLVATDKWAPRGSGCTLLASRGGALGRGLAGWAAGVWERGGVGRWAEGGVVGPGWRKTLFFL